MHVGESVACEVELSTSRKLLQVAVRLADYGVSKLRKVGGGGGDVSVVTMAAAAAMVIKERVVEWVLVG